MATANDDQDVTTVDDGQLQDLGAVEGEPTLDPATPTPSYNLARFLSSSRGGREGGRLDEELEDARREADRYRNEREDARRALEEANRRQDRQDALMDTMLQELRELRRQCFREVREHPDADFRLDRRSRIRLRAAEQSEISGRLAQPSSEPVTSTPSRVWTMIFAEANCSF